MTPRFSRYTLRTTDVAAAGAFYDAVLGRRGDGIVLLPEQAVARGARPQWLGHVGVGEHGGVDAVAARFVERGAMRLGPPRSVDGVVVLRDPVGAVVALTDATTESNAGVVWHQLNTEAPSKAADTYSELLGWSFAETLDLGKLGRHTRFAFAPQEACAGLLSDINGRPEVHTHWLYFFAVASLDLGITHARERGGLVLGPLEVPPGIRVAVCDDPQGAAFGLIETEDAAKLAKG